MKYGGADEGVHRFCILSAEERLQQSGHQGRKEPARFLDNGHDIIGELLQPGKAVQDQNLHIAGRQTHGSGADCIYDPGNLFGLNHSILKIADAARRDSNRP